jgi:hypothetical protein
VNSVKPARRLAWAAALATTCFAVPPAYANGRYPAANQLVISPVDPHLLVLRSTFGVLVSRDAGAHWDWVCEDAIGFGEAGTDEDPAIGVTQSAAILAGTQEGLTVSPDTGCSWSFVPNVSQWAVDVSVRRDQPASALALSRSFYGNVGDGGTTFSPALFSTVDNGATWAPYGAPLDPRIAAETVDSAPSDHRYVYVSGFLVVAGIPQGLLLASVDDGATWTPYQVPIDPLADIDVLIGGVDPTNPLRVYLRVVRTTGSQLVVTDDGGKTFRTVLTTTVGMPGFAISPDGSKVYLGGDDGVRVAPSATLTFTKVSDQTVGCLAASQTTLYACASLVDSSSYVLAASTDDGATFAPILHMCDIRGPLACGPGTSEEVCVGEWPLQRESIAPDAGPTGCPPPQEAGAESGSEGGVADAGTDVDAGEPADASSDAGQPGEPHKGGCSCGTVGIAGTVVDACLAPLLVTGLMFALQTRRRKRQPKAERR